MKTLDEVIAELEDEGLFADAIEWLKGYKAHIELDKLRDKYGGTSQNFADTSQITCPQCHSEFVILPEANNPLSWDELKQMEGKPVWVEQHHGDTKGWLLVLRKCDDVVTCTTKHGNSFYLYKANYGEKWQAYRKERE